MGYFELLKIANVSNPLERLTKYSKYYKSLTPTGLHYIHHVNKTDVVMICRPNHETHFESTAFLVDLYYRKGKINSILTHSQNLKKFLDFLLLWDLDEQLPTTIRMITGKPYPLEIILTAFADYLRLLPKGHKLEYAIEWSILNYVPLNHIAMSEGVAIPVYKDKFGKMQSGEWCQFKPGARNPIVTTACHYLEFLAKRTNRYCLIPINQLPRKLVISNASVLAGTLGSNMRTVYAVEHITKDVLVVGPASEKYIRPLEMSQVCSEEQVLAFLSSLNPRKSAQDKLLFSLACYLGIRPSEVANIKIDPETLPADFSNYHIAREQILNRLRGDLRHVQNNGVKAGWVLTAGTKTRSSLQRDIPWIVHKAIDEERKIIIRSFPNEETFLDMLYFALKHRQLLIGNRKDHGYLFVAQSNNARGNPIDRKTVYNKFQRIAQKLKKGTSYDLTSYSPHTFRHWYATILLRLYGVPIGDISRWLGHSSIEITHNTYIHWIKEASNNKYHGTVEHMAQIYREHSVLEEKTY